MVLFLYRDDYYHTDTKSGREVEIKIAKNRNSPVGTVKVEFVKEFGRFVGKNGGALKRTLKTGP
ncbi:DnaB-like helicase C-terminal domain-containing protein [Rossellomorea marisflavi]|uniref:DnaB-like helicase C-terminal domain-containing protein n=1 Tax=Rossellomorea marisflavi TaxID=189381 RepID=UPI0035180340